MLGIALKGLLLLLLTSAVALLLRRRSAAVKHLVWTVGLGATLALPLLARLVPEWRVVRIPATLASTGPETMASLDRPAAPAQSSSAPSPVERSAVPPSVVVISAPTESVRTPVDWSRVALLVWLAGMAIGIGWITLGEVAVRLLGRRTRPLAEIGWLELVAEAEALVGIRRPIELRETDLDLVPMTYGLARPVVVLPAAGREWAVSHRRDVLLHELSHVKRRDCLTHLLCRLALAVHWFNPLAWVAVRQARIEREQACDDLVLAAGAPPSRYAEELLATAQAMGAPLGLASAGLAMARRSQLADRLLSVLDRDRNRASLGRRIGFGSGFVALAVAVPLAAVGPTIRQLELPTQSEATVRSTAATPSMDRTAPTAGTIVSRSAALATPELGTTPKTRVTERGILTTLRSLLGQIPSVSSAPPVVEATAPSICPVAKDGKSRTVHLTNSMSITGQGSASDGNNSYVAWTGANCSVVIQLNGTVTFTDDERDVASISGSGRFSVTHTDGDIERRYDVRRRGGELERTYQVNGKVSAMDGAFESWRSALTLEYIRRSGYDAEARARRIFAKQGLDGVLEEIHAIPSDWSRGLYFKSLLGATTLDVPGTARVVTTAGDLIESDYELGQVLALIPAKRLEDESVRQGFISAAKTMESDYEKRKVLSAILVAGTPSGKATADILSLAATIESDYEVAELLVGLSQRGAVTSEFDAAYLAAVKTIESDYERHRVLSAMLKSGKRSAATLKLALEAARSIDSDFEAATFLKEVAGAGPITEELRPAYFAVVKTIDSDFERHGALAAALAAGSVTAMPESPANGPLIYIDGIRVTETGAKWSRHDRAFLSVGLVNDILDAGAGIDSDSELAGLLVEVVEMRLVTDATRAAFRRALGSIDSSYERQRVLAALGERSTEQ